jgi:alpha-glucosidase
MQWSPAANAGFCPPGVEPWLPLAGDHREVNVAVQSQDRRSMLALTRALLALRRARPALHAGDHDSVAGAPDDCLVYLRTWRDQRCLVALNFAGAARELRLPGLGDGRVLVSTNRDREGPVQLRSLELRADEGCIIELHPP